jgi:hypothetical protein
MPAARFPRRTLRLVFRYEGPEVELISADRVDMTPPPSDELRVGEGAPGFWYELHDADGRGLFRRVTENPFRATAEVLTDDRDRPIAREELGEIGGVFVLHAPDFEEAAMLLLLGSPPEPQAGARASQVLARFELPRRGGRPESG